MIEAARTTISPTAIWVLCIVMAFLAGFMVSAPLVADSYQARMNRRYRRALGIGPAPGGERASGVPGEQAPGIPGEVPTRVDLPAQRSGEADRAARSYAGPDSPDEAPHR
jgi:hypothetical protein